MDLIERARAARKSRLDHSGDGDEDQQKNNEDDDDDINADEDVQLSDDDKNKTVTPKSANGGTVKMNSVVKSPESGISPAPKGFDAAVQSFQQQVQ